MSKLDRAESKPDASGQDLDATVDQPAGSVTEPAGTQPGVAPAMPGAMANEATARLEPTINRLAHIMVALRPVGAPPLRSPNIRIPHH